MYIDVSFKEILEWVETMTIETWAIWPDYSDYYLNNAVKKISTTVSMTNLLIISTSSLPKSKVW